MWNSVKNKKKRLADKEAASKSFWDWMEERKALRQAAIDRADVNRSRPYMGIHRVPQHLQNLRVVPEVVVEHFDQNYATRRKMARAHGGSMRSGMNQPYYSPKRSSQG